MDVGERIPDITFRNTVGTTVSFASHFHQNGLVVLFLSGNCPFVQEQRDRIIALYRQYVGEIGFVAVYSNTDSSLSKDSSRECTEAQHKRSGYPFDLVYDEDQTIARTLGAVCTPDLFLFDCRGELFYHGRLDDNWREPRNVKREYLREAIEQLLAGNSQSELDAPPFGCTIKWNETTDDISATPFRMSAFLRKIAHVTELQLVHLINGTVVEVNPDTLEFIKSFREPTNLAAVSQVFSLPDDISDTFRKLVNMNFLVPEGFDEVREHSERIKLRQQRIGSGALLSILRLNIATGCNLRCVYCYMEKGPVNRAKTEHSKVMPWDVARTAVDAFLDNALSNGKRYVTIRYIGGEPLLNKKVLEKTMLRAKKRSAEQGIEVTHLLCTNGLLIDRRFAQFLVELGGAHALVSLDGLAEDNDRKRIKPNGSGTYDEILAAIKLLRGEGVAVSVPAVVNKDNCDRLGEFLEEMASLGIRQVGLNPEYRFDEAGTSAEQASHIAAVLLRSRADAQRLGITLTGKAFLPEWHVRNGNIANCEAMGRAIVVDPDGSLSVCDKLNEKCGTVTDFSAFIKSDRYRRFAMRVRGNIDNCSTCEARWSCNGGCAAEILIAGGDEKDIAVNCDFIRTMSKGIFESVG